jgi:hypothetical protein
MVIGLFLDGWSHRHQRPESFFTPWHATLYSGFAAAVVWSAWARYRVAQRDPELAARAIPGELITAIGVGLFAVGGVADFAWHQIFGIESSIKALLSPTHLLLMTGGLMALTGPVRAAWAVRGPRNPSWRAFAPILACVTLAIAVLSFFTQEISAFTIDSIHLEVSGNALGLQQMGIASILITNALLIGGWLYLLHRWRPPIGSATVMFTTVATLMTGLDSFHRLPLVLGAAAGGLAADTLVALRPRLTRRDICRLGAVTPAVMWTVWMMTYAAAWHLGWHPDLWVGTIFFTVLTGLGLAVLMFPAEVPVAA